MKNEKIPMRHQTVNITLGSPILERWLRYQFQKHGVTEIEIEMDRTDTMMIIKLKGGEFPEFDKHD